MIDFGENWLIYKDKIMKNLQDIITESILDDNIGDDSIVPMFFESIMNAKSVKEFKDVALSLKSYLDDDLGKDYKKALNKTKQNRFGNYLAINPVLSQDFYIICVSVGPSCIYYIKYYKSTNKVSVHSLNISFFDWCEGPESIPVYILNDKWNKLRKMIINKKIKGTN